MRKRSDRISFGSVFSKILLSGDDFYSFRYRGDFYVPVGSQSDGIQGKWIGLAGLWTDVGLRATGRGRAPLCLQKGRV